jgi:hypothetical protein
MCVFSPINIGVDACRENLQESSRIKLPNMLFIIASAQQLPHELYGLVSHITINFPWGSLLESLLNNDRSLLDGLSSISRSNAQMEIHLNGGALTEAGANLDTGVKTIHENMHRCGWQLTSPRMVDAQQLKAYPTTWARRLAHGRDPRAMKFSGIRAL